LTLNSRLAAGIVYPFLKYFFGKLLAIINKKKRNSGLQAGFAAVEAGTAKSQIQ